MKDTNSKSKSRTPAEKSDARTRRASKGGGIRDTGRKRPIGGDAPTGNGKAGEALPDTSELSRQIVGIAEKSQQLVAEFLERQTPKDGIGIASPLGIGAAFLEMTSRMIADPSRLVQAQLSLWHDYLTLWQRTTHRRFVG